MLKSDGGDTVGDPGDHDVDDDVMALCFGDLGGDLLDALPATVVDEQDLEGGFARLEHLCEAPAQFGDRGLASVDRNDDRKLCRRHAAHEPQASRPANPRTRGGLLKIVRLSNVFPLNTTAQEPDSINGWGNNVGGFAGRA
jgi:hypothetical protein